MAGKSSFWVCFVLLLLLFLLLPLQSFGSDQADHEKRRLEDLFRKPEAQNDDHGCLSYLVDFFEMGVIATSLYGIGAPGYPVEQVVESLKMNFGAFIRVDINQTVEDEYLIVFEEGVVAAQFSTDPSNAPMKTLSFEFPSGVVPISLDRAVTKLQEWSAAAQSKSILLVAANESVLAELNSEVPLAVGSAFKMFILSALKQQIDRGERAWTDILKLNPNWKSIGVLETWVDGSPLTLDTFASFMISLSENTAADHLLHLVGREAVENLTERNRPFFSTREFFILKAPENMQLLDQYRKLKTVAEREKFLSEVVDALPLPSLAAVSWTLPRALDIEYHFTAVELRDIMATVQSLPLMSIDPFSLEGAVGIVPPQDWVRIAFKGGSEPGVLSLSIWLLAPNGQTFYVILAVNDEHALPNEFSYVLLASRIIETLKLASKT